MFKDFLPPLVHDVNHTPPFYGHEKLFEKFLHSLQAQTLHHAWLLTGPQGIGKATAAKILARFLLRHADDSYPTEIPLSEPEDAIGRQTLEGTHPDFILIEKGEEGLSASKNFITIDAVRHVTQSIQQTSSHNGWKVVIVDSLDDMNEKAQNALLKSLEEPSQKTIFFLINHTASTLSPTIRSRCQEVKLQPLSPVLMEAFIKSNHLALTDAEKNLLILMAKGRLGIFQSLIAYQGLTLLDQIMDAIKEVLTRQQAPYPLCFKMSETLLKEGDIVRDLFYYLMTWYGHRTTERIATKDFSNPFNDKEKEIFNLLRPLSLEKWLTAQENILESMHDEQSLKLEPKQTILSCFTAFERAL